MGKVPSRGLSSASRPSAGRFQRYIP
jgi:hypothetical protein